MTDHSTAFRRAATLLQLRDYFDWHIQNGRGHMAPSLDPRGLSYLTKNIPVSLGLPLEGEGSHDGERVFIRAVF